MKHTMTLMIADRKTNAYMKWLGFRPDCKWYTNPTAVDFETTSDINEAYFKSIIEHSRTDKKFWIPGIIYQNNMIVANDVKIISDGLREMFVGEL